MPKKTLNPRIQISISIPKLTVQDLDGLIDGVEIRNRSHFVELAVADKIDKIRKSKLKNQQLSISDIKKKRRKK